MDHTDLDKILLGNTMDIKVCFLAAISTSRSDSVEVQVWSSGFMLNLEVEVWYLEFTVSV